MAIYNSPDDLKGKYPWAEDGPIRSPTTHPKGSATASILAVVTGPPTRSSPSMPLLDANRHPPESGQGRSATSSSISLSLRYLPLAVEPRERLRTPQFPLSLQDRVYWFPLVPNSTAIRTALVSSNNPK